MTNQGHGTAIATVNEREGRRALSEEQIREYVQRCPAENRWAFEGWLRGERHLDGDPIEPDLTPKAAQAERLWRCGCGWATF